jgi:hypothetical protein
VAMVDSSSAKCGSGGCLAAAPSGGDDMVMVDRIRSGSVRGATYVARDKITKTSQLH